MQFKKLLNFKKLKQRRDNVKRVTAVLTLTQMESFISFNARSENTQPHPIRKQNLSIQQTDMLNIVKLL